MPPQAGRIAVSDLLLFDAERAPSPASVDAVLGAMLGGQLAVGAVNELVDANLDAAAKPSKPIPSGLVSRRGAAIVAGAGLATMTLFSVRFDAAAFGLCALGTGSTGRAVPSPPAARSMTAAAQAGRRHRCHPSLAHPR